MGLQKFSHFLSLSSAIAPLSPLPCFSYMPPDILFYLNLKTHSLFLSFFLYSGAFQHTGSGTEHHLFTAWGYLHKLNRLDPGCLGNTTDSLAPSFSSPTHKQPANCSAYQTELRSRVHLNCLKGCFHTSKLHHHPTWPQFHHFQCHNLAEETCHLSWEQHFIKTQRLGSARSQQHECDHVTKWDLLAASLNSSLNTLIEKMDLRHSTSSTSICGDLFDCCWF